VKVRSTIKSRKVVKGNPSRRKGIADLVGSAHAPLFALASSEDVGKREFSGKARAATNVAATPLAATKILPKLLQPHYH